MMILPPDWPQADLPPGAVLHPRSGQTIGLVREAARAGELLVLCADGLAARPGWLVATDHISLFGDSPLVGPNRDDLGPRFPSLVGLYLAPDGPWKLGTVLRVPDWRLATAAELRASGAAAAVSGAVEEAVVAGHAGARVCMLVRCHGGSAWNRSAPPLGELLAALAGSSR